MYIRTKSKIYETESAFLDNNGKWVGYNTVEDDMAIILRSQVIREADTIEELCDEFVIEWIPTNHKDIFTIDKYSKEVVKSCIGNSKTKVYGAVWCEFGLKYIAKLNSKGEFELL